MIVGVEHAQQDGLVQHTRQALQGIDCQGDRMFIRSMSGENDRRCGTLRNARLQNGSYTDLLISQGIGHPSQLTRFVLDRKSQVKGSLYFARGSQTADAFGGVPQLVLKLGIPAQPA